MSHNVYYVQISKETLEHYDNVITSSSFEPYGAFSKRKYVAAFESEKGFMSLSGDVGYVAHDMLQLNEDSLFIQFRGSPESIDDLILKESRRSLCDCNFKKQKRIFLAISKRQQFWSGAYGALKSITTMGAG